MRPWHPTAGIAFFRPATRAAAQRGQHRPRHADMTRSPTIIRFPFNALLVAMTIWVVVSGQTELGHAGELVPRDLSDGETAAVFASSASAYVLGRILAHEVDLDSALVIPEPPAIDRWFRNHLHGSERPRTNFLDNNFGSAISPITALVIMSAIDIDREEFAHDIPMFLAGVVATKGLTDLTKGLVGRTRPCCRAINIDEYQDPKSHEGHSHSFFSGHASSVFFTSTFLNRRLRRHMRQEWTTDEYRIGRVLSPIITFSWATFVGMSRVHADRHYFTDVAAGALAGAVMGELFYRLAYESRDSDGGRSSAPMFMIRIPLP
ncbi:MAG: phosphatase PAP2 family protein [candidate division Zixibacteria bacterium]|nr:phosphatase PAP2 family protein [candidate division Zixibacteria bacterium]